MNREVMNDDITGLRRAFPDVPWDSQGMVDLRADVASFIQFVIDARELRRAEGITQKTMAERMETTQSCVSDFERIGGDPRIHTIQRYARAMGYRARLVLEKIPEDSSAAQPDCVSELKRKSPVFTGDFVRARGGT